MNRSNRGGFTLIELLVVIAIIGVLIALLLPAIQKVRESASRLQCQSNLKQIGVAMHAFHGQNKTFPSGTITAPGYGNHCVGSWAVSLLPFLEQQGMFGKLDLKQRFYDVSNPASFPLPNVDALKNFVSPIYICPTSSLPILIQPEDTSSFNWGAKIQAGNYVGIMGACNGPNDATEPGGLASNRVVDKRPAAVIQFNHGGIMATNGVIYHGESVSVMRITDGTSNTIMIGEQSDWGVDPGIGSPPTVRPRYDIRQTYRAGLWAGSNLEGMSSVTVRYPINTKTRVNFQDGIARYGWNTPILSAHFGGANVLRCDGGVSFLHEGISFDVLKYLCARDDGRAVVVDW